MYRNRECDEEIFIEVGRMLSIFQWVKISPNPNALLKQRSNAIRLAWLIVSNDPTVSSQIKTGIISEAQVKFRYHSVWLIKFNVESVLTVMEAYLIFEHLY